MESVDTVQLAETQPAVMLLMHNVGELERIKNTYCRFTIGQCVICQYVLCVISLQWDFSTRTRSVFN